MNPLKLLATKMLVTLILTAKQNLEGKKGADMEEWVVNHLTQGIEVADNLIPMIKAFVDEPWADKLEAATVKQGAAKGRELLLFAVRKAYAYAVANGDLKQTEEEKAKADDKVLSALGLSQEDLDKVEVAPGDATAKPAPTAPKEAGQDMYGNKLDEAGNLLNPEAATDAPVPPAPEAVQPNAQTESPLPEDDDKKILGYLQSEYSTGNGWYTFPTPEEDLPDDRVQGKEAAKKYLLDHPDLLQKFRDSTSN